MAPERRAEVVLGKLKGQLLWAWERSPFYRRLWGEAGVSPASLRTLADLVRFPVITKADIRADQEAHPPFGSNVCCPPGAIARVHGTSGTSGRAAVFAVSRDDWQRIGAAHGRIMWGFGVRPEDTVFIGSFFSLYMGSWGALAGVEALGARALPFGAGVPGQTERALEYLELIRPSVFYATPSYALHLAKVARERGLDPAAFGFRVMFFSGEPGAGIPATKRRIEGDGEGVPVYTHLERTSQPMIRLYSGDLTRVTGEPCPCGRTYRRLPDGIYGRVDDMLTVRGVNVYPNVVEDVLGRVAGVGPEYRIVLERPEELDVLTLEIESEEPTVAQTVREQVKVAVGVTPRVVVHPPNTLPTTEFKSRRVVDLRRAAPGGPVGD